MDKSEKNKFRKLLYKYNMLFKFLKKHNINKEINFDDWEDKDFNKLKYWIDAIEEGVLIDLNSKISLLGAVNIKDVKLSMFARKREDGKFEAISLWNSNIKERFYFKYGNCKDGYIETNNIYLILNSEAYQSDDINIDEMQESFYNKDLSKGELTLMNLQLLEVLTAYDITKNMNLLNYAKYLSNILMKNDKSSTIEYINYAQILKRENKLTDEVCKKLIEIRDNSNDITIKIGCNLLLENKTEVSILIKKLDSQTLQMFKKYPIAIYL